MNTQKILRAVMLLSVTICSGETIDNKLPSVMNITNDFYKSDSVRITNAFFVSINQSYLTKTFKLKIYIPKWADTVMLISNATAADEAPVTNCYPLKMGRYLSNLSNGDIMFVEDSLEHKFKNKKSDMKLNIIDFGPSFQFFMIYFHGNPNCTRTKSVVDITGIAAYSKKGECYNTNHEVEVSFNSHKSTSIKCIDDYKDVSIGKKLALVDVDVIKVRRVILPDGNESSKNIEQLPLIIAVIEFIIIIVGIILVVFLLLKKKNVQRLAERDADQTEREALVRRNGQIPNGQVYVEEDVPYPKGFLILKFEKYGQIREVYHQSFSNIEWATDVDIPEQWPENLTVSYNFESAPYTYRSRRIVMDDKTMPQKDVIFILKFGVSNLGVKVSAFLPNNNRCNKRLPLPFETKLSLKVISDNGENINERIEDIGFRFNSLCDEYDSGVVIININVAKIKFQDLGLKLIL